MWAKKFNKNAFFYFFLAICQIFHLLPLDQWGKGQLLSQQIFFVHSPFKMTCNFDNSKTIKILLQAFFKSIYRLLHKYYKQKFKDYYLNITSRHPQGYIKTYSCVYYRILQRVIQRLLADSIKTNLCICLSAGLWVFGSVVLCVDKIWSRDIKFAKQVK